MTDTNKRRPRKLRAYRSRYSPLTPEQRALAEAHVGYAASVIAARFGHLPARVKDDLLAEAYLGLCVAAQRYDGSTQFTTYAAWYVWGYAVSLLSKKLSKHVFGTLSLQSLGRTPDAPEDLLPHDPADRREPAPPKAADVRLRFARAIARCRPNNLPVVAAYFGLGGRPPQTIHQIAADLGVSPQAVAQRLNRELDRMAGIVPKKGSRA